jgi:ADP-heptose:LPS heptosyltransferase
VFIHENPAALCAIANDPFLLHALSLQGEHCRRFVGDVLNLDVFDLIVDVRYAVSYATPPMSRVPFQFVMAAHARAAEWQKYVRYDWPHLNNQFAKAVVARGMAQLDLVGYTANLPISQSTHLNFFIERDLPTEVTAALAGRRFMTIHHGADKNMSGGSGLQTKNLPIHIWTAFAARLKTAKVLLVQLGAADEELIEGADVDLRGLLSLEQSALVLKYADVHFDSEGGLVHLMRAVHGTSVVAFGPTPVAFFGYASNVNLSPKSCGDCWWLKRTWSAECPRDFVEPVCTSRFEAEDFWTGLQEVRYSRLKISPKRAAVPSGGDARTVVGALIAQTLGKDGANALVSVSGFDDLAATAAVFGETGIAATLLVRSSLFRDIGQMIPLSVRVLPWSRFHIPAPDETFGRALMLVSNEHPDVVFDHAIELRRVVQDSGDVVIAMPSELLPDFLKVAAQRGALLLGSKISCQFSGIASHVASFEQAGIAYSLIGLTAARSFVNGLSAPSRAAAVFRAYRHGADHNGRHA